MASRTDDTPEGLSLRDRLQGLMTVRVVLVTVFLGGTIVVDIEAFSSLSDPRNAALLALIVSTYLLTIAYGLLLERLESLVGIARFQLVADLLLTALLVLFTNGLGSVFIFLFYLNIINTAIVAGRRAAWYCAGATAAIMFGLGVVASADPTHPLLGSSGNGAKFSPLFFEVLVNSVAAFLIAFLSGRLTERLGETTLELQRKRDDLAQLRALTENILASLNSGLVTIDQSNAIIYFNRAASVITRIDREAALGASLDEIFPAIAEVLDGSDEQIPAVDETEPPGEAASTRYECEFTRPDGERVYLGYSISILRDSEGRPVGHIVVFQDLTEVKRLELAQKRSQKLAAVGELAASIAHEIRNPLASISGSVEMLETTADFDQQERSLMKIVLREVDRLDTLISEFLEYSRPSSMSFEGTDLAGLVDEVVELFGRRTTSAADQIDLEIGDEADEWLTEIDRESIRQVLWNLLNNASDELHDRSVEGTAVRVALQAAELDGETYHTILVEDAGGGVPASDRDKIFDPFFTTKDDGSGLGLATSHRLVDEHGGQIEVTDSERLGGAKFVVWLPVEQTPSSGDGEVPTGLHESSAPSPELANPAPSVPESS